MILAADLNEMSLFHVEELPVPILVQHEPSHDSDEMLAWGWSHSADCYIAVNPSTLTTHGCRSHGSIREAHGHDTGHPPALLGPVYGSPWHDSPVVGLCLSVAARLGS